MLKQASGNNPFFQIFGKGLQAQVSIILLLMLLAACGAEPALSPTAIPSSCLGFFVLEDMAHRCQESGNRALIESESEQITLEGFGASIVLRGQIEVVINDSSFLVNVIEGSAVVGARGRSRVVPRQNFVEVPLNNGMAQAPSEILPLIMVSPSPAAESTIQILQADALATATIEGECNPREDWLQTYTVQSGDVLSEIAEAYDLTIDEIAEANCLADPSRLRIGQVLRIAGDAPTTTPSAIAFRADSYNLQAGECTILRWDVFNVDEVYLDETETTMNSFLEICPEATTNYTLRVVFLDGSETERELSIQVAEDE